ncbi:MAG TPA: NfeD family protein [Candidatus Gastranaerophilales bacterium]|nr:NfeD family protein [Candidatus Gastranaerophilales bacterium]
MSYAYIWLIAGITLLILEIFTADFLLASIGISCLIASIPAFLGTSIAAQITTFSITAIIVFATIRPFIQKIIQGKNHAKELGLNTLINKRGIVTEEINNSQNKGHIKIDGDIWRACSETGENIEEGVFVKVKRSESITVYVERESE